MVLCLTHSGDYYTIDIVQQHLEKLGFQSVRLNTDEFAVQGQFTYTLSGNEPKICLQINETGINPAHVKAVWYRKGWELKVPDELDPAFRSTFIKEYNTHRQIFYNQLSHVPWMNAMEPDHAVNNDKFNQLIIAQSSGLQTPKTIFTNNGTVVRNFYDACNGDIVVKLHGSLSKSMTGNSAFFPTTRLTESDLARMEELVYCPMIFQEYIPKAYEMRIVYADGTFFTGQISYQKKEVTDWRRTDQQVFQWQHYELPSDIKEKIRSFMNKLNLHFGAIDMIRHKNGDYIFLEVNPQGEWGMLQRDLGYPIGETIAEKLTMRIADNSK
jgi:glutathione synthase/RimK-type ligase-like ATP-grasp enzyme